MWDAYLLREVLRAIFFVDKGGVTELGAWALGVSSARFGFSSVDFGCFNDSFSHIYVNFLEVMLVIWAILPPRMIGFQFRYDVGHQ